MAHQEQGEYIASVKQRHSQFFNGGKVLEVGSLNINGTVRDYFDADEYLGIDVGEGPGVDLVAGGHEFDTEARFDCTISCECFEHNPFWLETFVNMIRLTRQGGLVVFTCATTGRAEHGTARTSPDCSPLTVAKGWSYYQNLTEQDFTERLTMEDLFSSYQFATNPGARDLYFEGIKA
jgi:SAM-dependent methyltransferase